MYTYQDDALQVFVLNCERESFDKLENAFTVEKLL